MNKLSPKKFFIYCLAYIVSVIITCLTTHFIQGLASLIALIFILYIYHMIVTKSKIILYLILTLIINLILKDTPFESWLTFNIFLLLECLVLNNKVLMDLFKKSDLIDEQLDIIYDWYKENKENEEVEKELTKKNKDQ